MGIDKASKPAVAETFAIMGALRGSTLPLLSWTASAFVLHVAATAVLYKEQVSLIVLMSILQIGSARCRVGLLNVNSDFHSSTSI